MGNISYIDIILNNSTKIVSPEQQLLDAQYNALGNIYARFSSYLFSMIIALIIYSILEKILVAQRDGYWRINYIFGYKDIPFNQSEDFIKFIKMTKGILFGIMLAMTLMYFFIGRMFATEMLANITMV